MQLRELAADGYGRVAEGGGDVVEGGGEAAGAFEEDERAGGVRGFGQAAAAFAPRFREEAEEMRVAPREARDGERRRQRRGAGHGEDGHARLVRGLDGARAGVGDGGRARVGGEGDDARARRLQQARDARLHVVLGEAEGGRGRARALGERAQDARVLGGDEGGGAQDGRRALAQVGEVADGGGDDVEAGREFVHASVSFTERRGEREFWRIGRLRALTARGVGGYAQIVVKVRIEPSTIERKWLR